MAARFLLGARDRPRWDRFRCRTLINAIEERIAAAQKKLWASEGVNPGAGLPTEARPRAPFYTNPVNVTAGVMQGFPLYVYKEGATTVQRGGCKLCVGLRNAMHKICKCVESGSVTIKYDSYLYGRLRGDALFQPRNPKLLITLRNKAFRYLAEFDTSRYTSEFVTDVVEKTCIAVYHPSARQLNRVAMLKHRACTSAVSAYNNYLG